MNEKTIISLEIQVLNDLLRAEIIDKLLYDKAVEKLFDSEVRAA